MRSGERIRATCDQEGIRALSSLAWLAWPQGRRRHWGSRPAQFAAIACQASWVRLKACRPEARCHQEGMYICAGLTASAIFEEPHGQRHLRRRKPGGTRCEGERQGSCLPDAASVSVSSVSRHGSCLPDAASTRPAPCAAAQNRDGRRSKRVRHDEGVRQNTCDLRLRPRRPTGPILHPRARAAPSSFARLAKRARR